MSIDNLHNSITDNILDNIKDFVLNTSKYFNKYRWSIDRLDDLFIGCIEESNNTYEILIFNRVRQTGEYRRTHLILDHKFNIISHE